MQTHFKLDLVDGSLTGTVQALLRKMLESGAVDAVLAPARLPMKQRVMPMLIAEASRLEAVDPLAPAFPLNAARIVSRLTRKAAGSRIAAVMRPCEIRAFIELVKLKQGNVDELLLVGVDCVGAFCNTDYARIAENGDKAFGDGYCRQVLSGGGTAIDGLDIASSCKACEQPVPKQADIQIQLFGVADTGLFLRAGSEKGTQLLEKLDLKATEAPQGRSAAVEKLLDERRAYAESLLAETEQQTDTVEKLTQYLADCVNCYNCRVACPVCYCKECVFSTDVFFHEPAQYLKWADRKGAIKMPTDTIFYHLTRMAHMSTTCVGCGQCSNACPNDIPVSALFVSLSKRTQSAFDYHAGQDLVEKPPLSEFKEQEYEEVVG